MKSASALKNIEQYPYELIGSRYYYLLVTIPFFPFLPVIMLENIRVKNTTHGHAPIYSPQMWTSSFRYFQLSPVLSVFINHRGKSSKGQKFLIGTVKPSDILPFGKESGDVYFTYSRNRSKYFHIFGTKKLDFLKELRGEGIDFFQETEESSNSPFEDRFSIRLINADSIVRYVEYGGGIEVDFSTLAFVDFIDNFLDFFRVQLSCNSCGGYEEKEMEPELSGDIVVVEEFFKDVEEELFDVDFEAGDVVSEGFIFADEEFNGVIGRKFFEGILVFQDEVSGDFVINFVGFSFSEGGGFAEVVNENIVNENTVKL